METDMLKMNRGWKRIYEVIINETKEVIYSGGRKTIANRFRFPSIILIGALETPLYIKGVGDCTVKLARATPPREPEQVIEADWLTEENIALKELSTKYKYYNVFLKESGKDKLIIEGTFNGLVKSLKTTEREMDSLLEEEDFIVENLGRCYIKEIDSIKRIPWQKQGESSLTKIHIKLYPSHKVRYEETSFFRLKKYNKDMNHKYILTRVEDDVVYWIKPLNILCKTTGLQAKTIKKAYKENTTVEVNGVEYTVNYKPGNSSPLKGRKGDKKNKCRKSKAGELFPSTGYVKDRKETEKSRIKAKMVKSKTYKGLVKGEYYHVYNSTTVEKNLQYLRSDYNTLYFKHALGYVITFPRLRNLTSIEEANNEEATAKPKQG